MEYIDYKKIPNCLRKYRKARGLKQKEVSDILGLKNTSMISRWEQGVCLPNILNVFKLTVLYRVQVDTIFFDLKMEIEENIKKREKLVLKQYER